MPQISKIRIVNFQYNDGKRLIADELYDFESENSGPSDVLINLANGGGKSVLVQLMMQPVIPKAKVAGRRMESFFTKASDHCYVVIEWALDGSSMKLMTGIAMAASDSANDTDSDRGFQIKYYTFISSYQDYRGSYNIISLPLSGKEGSRFIPAAFDDVRNLAKKSGGALDRYSSDDSSRWQERLSQYGIIQNEWRLIEELNSNEDGLSKYFSSLKTSDAVIDRLIIPRIEENQNRGCSREDSSLETMLLSYAKQFSKHQDTIREREILAGFHDDLSVARTEAEKLWSDSESMGKCIAELFAYSDALNAEIVRQSEKAEKSEGELKRLNELIRHIRWEEASSEFYSCKDKLERENVILSAAEDARTKAQGEFKEAEKKVLLLQCAHYFGQLKDLESRISAISEEIANRENNSESAERLAALRYSAYMAIQAELARIMPEAERLSGERNSLESSMEELNREISSLQRSVDAAKSEKDKAEAVLERQIDENDAAAEELSIGFFRMLDGSCREDELSSWHSDTEKKEKAAEENIKKAENKLQRLETRRDEIPQEAAEEKSALDSLKKDLGDIDERMSEYHSLETDLQTVYERHGLDFSRRFTGSAADYLNEQKTRTEALIKGDIRKIEETEEIISAVGRGTLHIPERLSAYLNDTGIRYTSVEKYILTQQENVNLSKEECFALLERYPYAAYGIIVEFKDKETLCLEAEGCFLPSVLPVFTAEDMAAMLDENGTEFSAVAAYSGEYFRDHSSYAEGLRDTLEAQKEQRRLHEEREHLLEEDEAVIRTFSAYNAEWETDMISKRQRTEEEIARKEKQLKALNSELHEIKENIQRLREEEKSLRLESTAIKNRLAAFGKLIEKLEEEKTLRTALSDAQKKLRDIEAQQSAKKAERSEREARYKEICSALKESDTGIQSLSRGLEKVKGAAEAELIDDEWSSLLTRYEELLSAQSADLKRLNDDKNRLLEEEQEKRREIEKRGCLKEEYEVLVYSDELETEAEEERRISEANRQNAERACLETVSSQAKAESSFENAAKKLKEYGGEALPMNEVGDAFDARIEDIRVRLSEIESELRSADAALSRLQKVQGKAEQAVEAYERPAPADVITLDADYAQQLTDITIQIRRWKKSVESGRIDMENLLRKMSDDYSTGSMDIGVAVSSMLELMSAGTVHGDRYYTLFEHIDANMHTAELRISQIDTDLREFRKTKGDLIHQCVIQGRQMYEGLQQLSANSKVRVHDKRRQMLKFDIPDAVDENVANAAITAEIDKGTGEIAAKMSEETHTESEIRRLAERTVGSRRLLRRYIGSENIVLKAYKIDRNPDNSGYRTWEQTQVNNSGAEKFVVYFAVILALMAYARDAYDEMGGKNNRSVLILDNPFGPISSKHVLEPMFEIAGNYKVQMICLSDISKSDIISCFDLVIRAVVKQFALSAKEQLTHEGNESIEHGFYRAEQLNLFG